MNLISQLLGWVMYGIYNVVHSYGFSIILSTLVIKILTLPATYATQVNQARMGLISSKVEKIKKSFANNPTRFQEEQNKLYQQEGINPSSGCLSSILMMVLILGFYGVVTRPVTYILHMDSEMITKAQSLLTDWLNNANLTEKYLQTRPELILLRYARTNPEIFESIKGFSEQLGSFNNTFLGFDLAGSPSLHPENGWSFTAVMLLMLPILSGLAQLCMTIVTQRHSRKTNPAMAQQMGSMNAMLYLSPLMSVWIGMSVPAGLSFYWLVSSLLSLGIQVLLYKYLSGDRLIAINEKEKQKQIAKGPSWMQRMMEQSAQIQAEQQNMTRDGNHTSYSDGDDGMSRKDRAEYEKALIDAARERAALKYGDELSEDAESK
ncbi:MAG: YidC/Oxa1 family membrane protein insertase [Oscillospiraceae bacterium]|nr:YidC/Oxa1 family membrane protein insertase [Oscillospiraceae bacterium]